MVIKIKEDYFQPLSWCILVAELASGYFVDNKYTPHFGILNAMRLFINECVEEIDGEAPQKMETIDDIAEYVGNNEFLYAFENTIYDFDDKKPVFALTFSRAWDTAHDMVSQKKNSWGEVASILSDGIDKLLMFAEQFTDEENLNLIQKLAGEVKGGDITADSIIKAYEKTMKPAELKEG